MAALWFTGILSIVILLFAGVITGYFTLSEFTNYLHDSGNLIWIILIFGLAAMLTGLSWFTKNLRKYS